MSFPVFARVQILFFLLIADHTYTFRYNNLKFCCLIYELILFKDLEFIKISNKFSVYIYEGANKLRITFSLQFLLKFYFNNCLYSILVSYS